MCVPVTGITRMAIKAARHSCRCRILLPLYFSMSDLMAYGAINAALDQGLVLPDELSIHGFDNLELSPFTRPALSTVSLPLREMGAKTAEVMLQILNNTPPEKQRILIPCSHVDRSSVKKCM